MLQKSKGPCAEHGTSEVEVASHRFECLWIGRHVVTSIAAESSVSARSFCRQRIGYTSLLIWFCARYRFVAICHSQRVTQLVPLWWAAVGWLSDQLLVLWICVCLSAVNRVQIQRMWCSCQNTLRKVWRPLVKRGQRFKMCRAGFQETSSCHRFIHATAIEPSNLTVTRFICTVRLTVCGYSHSQVLWSCWCPGEGKS